MVRDGLREGRLLLLGRHSVPLLDGWRAYALRRVALGLVHGSALLVVLLLLLGVLLGVLLGNLLLWSELLLLLRELLLLLRELLLRLLVGQRNRAADGLLRSRGGAGHGVQTLSAVAVHPDAVHNESPNEESAVE